MNRLLYRLIKNQMSCLLPDNELCIRILSLTSDRANKENAQMDLSEKAQINDSQIYDLKQQKIISKELKANENTLAMIKNRCAS